MSIEAYLLAAIAVSLTGLSKSGFAGGLGILGVPVLTLVMPAVEAAALLLPILVCIDVLSVWRYRAAWSTEVILALLPGAGIGILLGAIGFAHLDPNVVKIGIGLMALGFVARIALAGSNTNQTKNSVSRPGIFLASLVSGFAGFVAHAGGPPIKAALLTWKLEKTAFVATNSVFFFILNGAKVAGYAMLGLFSISGLAASASLLPFVGLGVAVGFALHNRISQTHFTHLAYGLLALAGVNLVIGGVSDVIG
ncbi:MAG: sulfite exporter TauE/SafE family protein [Pseudomonadota bacterium]